MMLYEMFLQPLQEMRDFMSHKNGPMSFHPLPYSLCVIELTLCYQLMVSTHWQMLSSATPLKLIWFHELFFFMGLQ